MSDYKPLNKDPSGCTEENGNLNLKYRKKSCPGPAFLNLLSQKKSVVLYVNIHNTLTHQQIPLSFGFASSFFPPDGITIQTSTHWPWYTLSGHLCMSALCNMVDEVIFTVKDCTSAISLSLTWPSAHPFSPAIY
jgi:hypothetical protein